MILSMTGFGKGIAEQNGWLFTAEVRSLNNRYLDINIKLPRNLSYLEEDLRKLAQQNLSRGRIEITVISNNADNEILELKVNQSLVSAYVSCLNNLAQEYDLDRKIPVSTFLKIPDIFTTIKKDADGEAPKKLAVEALRQAVVNLKAMKCEEGSNLRADISNRIALVTNYVEGIKERAPLLVLEYTKRIKEKLKEILDQTDFDEGRFNAEVVYYAERSSITEELVRLESHFFQMKSIMDIGGAVGRKLDFLVQEINREINTISAKVGDLSVINTIIEIKSEIEKIREQIQNIE